MVSISSLDDYLSYGVVTLFAALVAVIFMLNPDINHEQRQVSQRSFILLINSTHSLCSFKGIEQYENMKSRMEEMKRKHNLGPAEMFKLIQERSNSQTSLINFAIIHSN